MISGIRLWVRSRPGVSAVLAGALAPLAFAPFDFTALAWLTPVLLFRLWLDAEPRQAFLSGWWFGVGLLAIGVSWVQVSIDQFCNVGRGQEAPVAAGSDEISAEELDKVLDGLE